MTFKVCCISDTHASHAFLEMPDADILIHSGDFSGVTNQRELFEFNAWLGSLEGKYREIFFVPGNHDGQFENYYFAESILTNAVVLFDKTVEFAGYKIHGSPWTIKYFDWWFMKERSELEDVWKKIPDDTDILITHQPPYMILDRAWDDELQKYVNAGCPILRKEITNRLRNLKLHTFGHLHKDGGNYLTIDNSSAIFCNASINTDDYIASRKPIVIEL